MEAKKELLPLDHKLSEHFTVGEVSCYCGCGFGTHEGDVGAEAMRRLELMREEICRSANMDVPLRITPKGGCRCPEANAKAGGAMPDSKTGAPGSAHLRGTGFDILPAWGWHKTYLFTGLTRFDFIKIAEEIFAEGGVGSNLYGVDGIIHVDYDPELIKWKRFRRW